MRSHIVAGVALVFLGFSGQALSKVTTAAAQRLGDDLTPVGAERAGNRSGSIPEWTGGLATPPDGWGEGQVEIDPFPEDEALFVITTDNVHLYRDKLSDGHIAMLEKYGPDFFMPVLPPRPTGAFTEPV